MALKRVDTPIKLELVLIRIHQRNRTNRLFIHLLVCGKVLDHVIMHDVKFHTLSSVSYKCKKTCSSIQSKFKDLGNSSASGAIPGLRAEEDQMTCPSPDSGAEGGSFLLSPVSFYLGPLESRGTHSYRGVQAPKLNLPSAMSISFRAQIPP